MHIAETTSTFNNIIDGAMLTAAKNIFCNSFLFMTSRLLHLEG